MNRSRRSPARGKVFLVGLNADGGLSVRERSFNRCMGLCAHGNSLYLGGLFQIWRFENVLAAGETHEGYDRLYVPQVAYFTGDLDAHDVGVLADGRLVFVNTLFNCLATLSETHSFVPLWNPGFISRLAAEDRCHLNGLALRDGKPAYVTAVAKSDTFDGWRDQRRAAGGIVIDVVSGEIVCDGLSMPHSPRWHQGKIAKSLGYRLVMTSANLPDAVKPVSSFSGTINLMNVGWGKIYNKRDCELVFRETETKKEFIVKLTNDPRHWCMTDSAVAVNVSALIPASTPEGLYAVYLNLPDPAGSSHSRPEYSIRVANKYVWEDATGYNSLLHKVTISPAQ